jgi:hypothetical protein
MPEVLKNTTIQMAAILWLLLATSFADFYLNHTHFVDCGRIRREDFAEL